jgi:hypothetical protein
MAATSTPTSGSVGADQSQFPGRIEPHDRSGGGPASATDHHRLGTVDDVRHRGHQIGSEEKTTAHSTAVAGRRLHADDTGPDVSVDICEVGRGL